ncbi:MAG: SMP-30/gluconolactonase/LRE family protein [Mycobacterium sp.]
MVTAIEARPFVDGIVFGEGPRWRSGRLWFTDSPAGTVYSVGEIGDLATEVEVERPSGLGWLPDGTLVVSSLFAPTVHFVDAGGTVIDTVDVSDAAWSTNDLVVTADGRIFVDLYQHYGTAMGGGIGLLQRNGDLRVVATDLAVPNGLGVLPDGLTLVVNETNGSRVLAYSFLSDGGLGEQRVFADLPGDCHPDGLCVDAEGAVWVGCYDTGEFLRVRAGGEVTHRISVDQGWAVAPCLGGADGRTLYMAVNDTTHEGLMAGTSTGWIMQARVDVPGAGSP